MSAYTFVKMNHPHGNCEAGTSGFTEAIRRLPVCGKQARYDTRGLGGAILCYRCTLKILSEEGSQRPTDVLQSDQ